MRKRHWLSTLLSGALWATLPALGLAQAPDAGWGGGPGAPPAGYVPYIDPNSPQAAAYAPGYSGMEAAGWPQGANQWPYISPYTSPAVDQTSYQNGFWFNEQVRDRRKYFTYLGGTFNTYAKPDDVTVGDGNAPGFLTTPVLQQNQQNVVSGALFDIADRHSWSDVEGNLSGGGFSGILGWMNPNDTGVYATGFWAEEGSALFDPINPIGDPTRPESTLRVIASVPLFDGQGFSELPVRPPDTEPVIVPGGGAQRYDMLYRLGYSSLSYGSGIGLYGSSFYKADMLKVRPVYGLRYLHIRENATFDGLDSGLTYTVDGSTLRPVPGSVVGVGLVDVLESHLRSNTSNYMGGPELGLRFDLGGDKFRIELQSKLGILANHSKREVDGYGIGRTFGQIGTPPITPIPSDPAVTGFAQEETTTSVSPTFEQTIMVSLPILQYVPIVRKSKLFDDAEFRFGYTWLVAGSVYRAGNVIDWKGFPNFPEVNSDKTTWFMSSWNMGIQWNY